jgi:glucose/arabinose dehydrogenase
MRIFFVILLVFGLWGCSNSREEGKEVNVPITASIIPDSEVLSSYLNVPWDIAKVDKSFYISERGGRIIFIDENGKKSVMPLKLKKDVSEFGEGGLLGFILHPDFKTNQIAFIYHTYQQSGKIFNRIVQVQKVGYEWVENKELLNGLPGARIHNGGRLEIGPDGKLYATVGDADFPDSAQNINVLSGKILRMNLDGTIPSDNPFKNSYVYSYGHRNPQGITWTETGDLFSAEHGARGFDEINQIKAGQNYGWPTVQGDETRAGLVPPIFHSGNSTWAPSGLTYDKGKLYVAGLAGQQLRVFDLQTNQSYPLYKNVGRLRDLLVDNGIMYIITNNTDGRGIPDRDDDHLLRIQID